MEEQTEGANSHFNTRTLSCKWVGDNISSVLKTKPQQSPAGSLSLKSTVLILKSEDSHKDEISSPESVPLGPDLSSTQLMYIHQHAQIIHLFFLSRAPFSPGTSCSATTCRSVQQEICTACFSPGATCPFTIISWRWIDTLYLGMEVPKSIKFGGNTKISTLW